MHTLNEQDVYHNNISKILALGEQHTLYTVVFVSFFNPKTKREEGVLHIYDNRLNVLECTIPLVSYPIIDDFIEYYFYIMRVPHILILDTSEDTTTLDYLPEIQKYNIDAVYAYNGNDWSPYLRERKGLSRLLGNATITGKILSNFTTNAFMEIVVHQDKAPYFDAVVSHVDNMAVRILSYLPLSGLPVVYVYATTQDTLIELYDVLTGNIDVQGVGTDIHERFLKEALRTDVLHSKVNRSDFGRVLVSSLLVSHRESEVTVQPLCLNCEHEYHPEVVKLSDLVFDMSVSEVGEHVVATFQGKNYYYIDMPAKYNDVILTETTEASVYSKILSIPMHIFARMSEEEVNQALEIHNNITESLTMSLTYAEDTICPGCKESVKTIELISPIDILSQILDK